MAMALVAHESRRPLAERVITFGGTTLEDVENRGTTTISEIDVERDSAVNKSRL
jgi:hypothetical protein